MCPRRPGPSVAGDSFRSSEEARMSISTRAAGIAIAAAAVAGTTSPAHAAGAVAVTG